ncbi:ankyrin repeat-containing domain protein, partial [Infundibulicybe gibba]
SNLAAGFGNARIAKLLLDKGDDVNSRSHGGKAPLSLAARRGHEDFVKLLLAQDGIHVNPVDSKGYTPLDWAEKRCDSVNIVKLFREAGGRTGRELREGSREGSVKEETLANTPLVTASR